ncbi:MAG TPA: lipid-binding SYLF domain-containing protein [Steroidobacteraceae bacterium]|jgi:lipid-binding SYLF domain-containing protein|nr:lipid-binding SYLF domain-containing protein [Steroidobacteraceae bacterium]
MKAFGCACVLIAWLALPAGPAFADDYSDTVALFQHAGTSAVFFGSSYGYAVFPTIGKGGFGIGAAHGNGRVYRHGQYVGDTSMTQLSIGFQAGGQAYSEIIFFQDQRAFSEFTAGKYAFSGNVSAIAITAGASASAGTAGSGASASGGEKDARTAGQYQEGVAVFTIAKGGLMYEASVAGQKFSYRARGER